MIGRFTLHEASAKASDDQATLSTEVLRTALRGFQLGAHGPSILKMQMAMLAIEMRFDVESFAEVVAYLLVADLNTITKSAL